MSEIERKAVKTIVLISGLIAQGHFKVYAPDVLIFLDKLYTAYCCTMSKQEYTKLKKEVFAADAIIGNKDYDSTLAMMFAMLIEAVEPFARFTKGERGELWRGLYDYARNNEIHKTISKKSVLPEFDVTSIDRGIEIAEVIKN